MTDRSANPRLKRISSSPIDRRSGPLPDVFLRGESFGETTEELQEAVVARAEARARVRQRRNGSRLLRGTDRQFAEALHREADGLHYKGDYETALVLYHRAAGICPRDSSHGVAARRTAAAINALSNPSKTVNGLLPRVRNGAQESAVVCPESAAVRASRILSESADPVSVVPHILGFFDKRPDFWRVTRSPRASLTRGKTAGVSATATPIAEAEALLAAGNALDAIRIGEEIIASLVRRDSGTIDRLEAEVHRLVASAHVALGRHDRAAASASRMIRAARAADVPLLTTRALVTLGKVHLSFGHLDAAARAWEGLVPCVSEPIPRAWLFHEIGRCHLEKGDERRAFELATDCLKTARAAGSEKWIFHGQLLLGQTLVQLGRFAAASKALRELLPAGEEAGDVRTLAYVRDLADRLSRVSDTETRRIGVPDDQGSGAVNSEENFRGDDSSESSVSRSLDDRSSESDRRTGGTADSTSDSSVSPSSLRTADSPKKPKFQPSAAAGDPGDPGEQDSVSIGPPRASYESICCTGRTYEVLLSPPPRRFSSSTTTTTTTTTTPRTREANDCGTGFPPEE